MDTVTVALLQMKACGNDQKANLLKGETFCRRAAHMGADIALFPEMWSIGYCPPYPDAFENPFDPSHQAHWETWKNQAIARENDFVMYFQELASELNMAMALTYLEKWEPGPRNSVSIINQNGDVIMTYAKVHTCDFSGEHYCTPGDGFYTCTLETKTGPVKLGTMICYDREFPESARILMLQGAELILVPNACPMDEHRRHQLEVRAFENMVGIALANYAGPGMGHSVAYDGMAYNRDGSPRDMLVVEAGEGEEVYLAAFDIAQLREYRQRETWGDAFRKPGCYSLLTATDVKSPFIRKEARRCRTQKNG